MKDFIRKTWKFLWHDDSVLSWIVNIIIIFLLIKFIIYPGVGGIMGTQFPVVAVVSESMEHSLNEHEDRYFMCGNTFEERISFEFEEWWDICGEWYEEEVGITIADFENFPFQNGLYKGDIIISTGRDIEDIEVGDVIIFESNRPIPIIHRVVEKVEGEEVYVKTKGDNNRGYEQSLGEEKVTEDRILGVANYRVPYLGYMRIYASKVLGF